MTLLAIALAAATVTPANDIQWLDVPAFKGAKMAVLWGNPKTSGYGCLKKFPAGAKLPLHSHSSDHRVLVLAGTVEFTVEGREAQTLGPQSYVHVPPGLVHAVACSPDAECTVFEEQPGPTDFIRAEAPAPKK